MVMHDFVKKPGPHAGLRKYAQDIIEYDEEDRNILENKPVYIPMSGTVINVDNNSSEHSLVRIRVSKELWYYMSHLKPGSIIVKKDQKVKTGQKIALMGKLVTMVPHMHIQFVNRFHVTVKFVFKHYKDSSGKVFRNKLPKQGEVFYLY